MVLTKWSGSASQTLMAPSIFFLSTLARNSKKQNHTNRSLRSRILDSNIYHIRLKEYMCGTLGFHLYAWKGLVPLQNLRHILPGVPAVSHVARLGVRLSSGRFLVFDEVILSGKICGVQCIFTLAKSGSWNVNGQIYGDWHLESIDTKEGLGDGLLREVACLKLACKLHVVTVFPLVVEPVRNL